MNKSIILIVAILAIGGIIYGVYSYVSRPKLFSEVGKSPTEVYKLFKAESDRATNYEAMVKAYAHFVAPKNVEKVLAGLTTLTVADQAEAYRTMHVMIPPLAKIKTIEESVDGDKATLSLTAEDGQQGVARFTRENGIWYLTAEKFGL